MDRAIQYAAAQRFNNDGLWNTGSPACAGDDTALLEGDAKNDPYCRPPNPFTVELTAGGSYPSTISRAQGTS
jgi:hypothetical protein